MGSCGHGTGPRPERDGTCGQKGGDSTPTGLDQLGPKGGDILHLSPVVGVIHPDTNETRAEPRV